MAHERDGRFLSWLFFPTPSLPFPFHPCDMGGGDKEEFCGLQRNKALMGGRRRSGFELGSAPLFPAGSGETASLKEKRRVQPAGVSRRNERIYSPSPKTVLKQEKPLDSRRENLRK